jgi:phosphate transport system substrate-binding protein
MQAILRQILTPCLICAGITVQAAEAGKGRDALEMQQARAKTIDNYSKKSLYPADTFNLDDLPPYVPEKKVSGILHIWGSDMFGGAGLRKDLATGFRKFQAEAKIEYSLKSNMLAVTGLLDGTAEIGQTHTLTWETLLGFQRFYGYDPLTINGMRGWSYEPPFAIMVNRSNPIKSLTMRQLDGIYGAERTGGWTGVPLTLQTVRDHSYPLAENIPFFINRKPGTPMDPTLKEFMRYVLSREGQGAVVRDGKMLPLTAADILEERKKLD